MKTRMKRSHSDNLFDFFNVLFIGILVLVIAYPLLFIVSASLSSPYAVVSGKVWLLPVQFTWRGYEAVFRNDQVLIGYANSAFYTIVGTLLNVAMTVFAAYPLSRRSLKGRGLFTFLFVFTMLFSGGLIPSYFLVKDLGLIDTRLSLILPGAMAIWNMIITRTYFQTTIPEEMYDSAQVDGSGDIRTFFRIILPVSGPILAVNALFYAVGHWNSYFDALLYIKRASLYPLQIVLRNILIVNSADMTMIADVKEAAEREGLIELLKYSLIVVASAPVLILYPFVQKYFVKGMMIGSVKG
ncbi:carbohydrate ABC transporter permease [Paenibacillus cymbidii]|uniref:carbohydrate ABC transporter permease n=1 Tax=Paenibacillus cymbidii TaxID=1639034 RepID=UPI001080C39C|nr:carbohydrate ABC transporter permease [Paenibacillus cymbidii]